MTAILLILAALGLALSIVLFTSQNTKRGCGRGCATCGNRTICHRGQTKTTEKG